MRKLGMVLAAGLGLVLAAAGAAQAPPALNLQTLKYNELTEAIRRLRGQVVVVDFWADYCVPCKREFPKLVALHEKHRKDGLAVVAVSLDDPAETGAKDKVLKFLTAQHAAGTNVILDEKPAVWQERLKIDGPPCVYVFNRQGALEQRFADDCVDYAAIEKLVGELLRK